MHHLVDAALYIAPFIGFLTILVFVHEFGHFWTARRCGVRVEAFSIGFGPELFGWTDRTGTRWKFCAAPFGGYVKMFGQSDEAEVLDDAVKAVSFKHKTLGQRALILAAGPAANFLFAVAVFAVSFATIGEPFTPPVVAAIAPHSAAADAGVEPGDRILSIDGQPIARFEDVQSWVHLDDGAPLHLAVARKGRTIQLAMTPRTLDMVDRFGAHHAMTAIGVAGDGMAYVRRGPIDAVQRAGVQTYDIARTAIVSMWQMAIGLRPTDDLGGPIGIARLSHEVAEGGLAMAAWFIAVLSVNLGLVNLFPIPILDGGHLAFCAFEAVRGRPAGPRVQEFGMRFGIAVVVCLMAFATWNDIMRILAR